MLCDKCRCKLEEGAAFCRNCGAPVEGQGGSFFQQASDLGAPSERDAMKTRTFENGSGDYLPKTSIPERPIVPPSPSIPERPIIPPRPAVPPRPPMPESMPYVAPGSQPTPPVYGSTPSDMPLSMDEGRGTVVSASSASHKKSKTWLIVLLSVLLVVAIGAGAIFAVDPFDWFSDDEEKTTLKGEFEYNDEMRAHVLKTATPRVWINMRATVSYRSVVLDEQALRADLEEIVQSESGSGVNARVADHISENIVSYLRFGEERVEQVGFSGHGSGVVISEDGYIATNAHVAAMSENSKMEGYASSISREVMSDLSNILQYLNMQYGVSLTEAQQEDLANTVWSNVATKIEILDEGDSEILVQFPTSDGRTGDNEGKEYRAKLVAHGTEEGEEGRVRDIAIIKINANNLVALPLASSYPEANTQITTAGYPSNSEYIFQDENQNSASALSVTITDGKIARVFPIDGQDYKGIEITSTISGGNSGGPSVDNNLNIEGLNTYGLGADMRYAYMVPAAAVIDLVKDAGIVLQSGETTKTFLAGIQHLQKKEYDKANECFVKVKQVKPDTPYIDELIEKTKKK